MSIERARRRRWRNVALTFCASRNSTVTGGKLTMTVGRVAESWFFRYTLYFSKNTTSHTSKFDTVFGKANHNPCKYHAPACPFMVPVLVHVLGTAYVAKLMWLNPFGYGSAERCAGRLTDEQRGETK